MIFLHNHGELTPEMIIDGEHDYPRSHYAANCRVRPSLGTCRRLAPLVERDRWCIEPLHSLLLSMPDMLILYYGDETGVGDNIYLGDHDGVRTLTQ